MLSKSELGDIHELIDSNQKLLPTAVSLTVCHVSAVTVLKLI